MFEDSFEILRFWHFLQYNQFYEVLTVRPLLDPMSVTHSFKKKISINFPFHFFYILSLMAQYLLGMKAGTYAPT